VSEPCGDRVDLTLLAPEPDFAYKPLLVVEPLGLGAAECHELTPLAAEQGARFVQRVIAPVRVGEHLCDAVPDLRRDLLERMHQHHSAARGRVAELDRRAPSVSVLVGLWHEH
jgi:hypothetical protein